MINRRYLKSLVTKRLSEATSSAGLKVNFDTKKVLGIINGQYSIDPKEQVSIIVGDLPEMTWRDEGFQDLYDSIKKQFKGWVKNDLAASLGDSVYIRWKRYTTTSGGEYQIITKDSDVYIMTTYKNVLGAYIARMRDAEKSQLLKSLEIYKWLYSK